MHAGKFEGRPATPASTGRRFRSAMQRNESSTEFPNGEWKQFPNAFKRACENKAVSIVDSEAWRWLGREGSNLRMAESKSAALPLGYAPTGFWKRRQDTADSSSVPPVYRGCPAISTGSADFDTLIMGRFERHSAAISAPKQSPPGGWRGRIPPLVPPLIPPPGELREYGFRGKTAACPSP